MILQIFSKYARGYDMSGSVMIYVMYCHDFKIFSNYAREICQVVS